MAFTIEVFEVVKNGSPIKINTFEDSLTEVRDAKNENKTKQFISLYEI